VFLLLSREQNIHRNGAENMALIGVEDTGCLSRLLDQNFSIQNFSIPDFSIPDFGSEFFHPGSRVEKIPDPDPQ
jgi:hypothetical protein